MSDELIRKSEIKYLEQELPQMHREIKKRMYAERIARKKRRTTV